MSRHVAYDRGRAIRYAAMASAAYRPRELLTSWGAHARGDGDGDGDDDLRLALSSLGGPDERRFLGADASVSVLDVVDVPSEDVRFYLAEVRDATGIERPRLALVFRGTADETPDDWLPGGAFDGARGRVDADFDFDLDLERDETRRRDPGAGESFGTLGERASESGSRASEESSAKSRRRRDPLPVHAAFYPRVRRGGSRGRRAPRRLASRRARGFRYRSSATPSAAPSRTSPRSTSRRAGSTSRRCGPSRAARRRAPRAPARTTRPSETSRASRQSRRRRRRRPGFPLYHHVGAALACEREEEDGGPGPVDDARASERGRSGRLVAGGRRRGRARGTDACAGGGAAVRRGAAVAAGRGGARARVVGRAPREPRRRVPLGGWWWW